MLGREMGGTKNPMQFCFKGSGHVRSRLDDLAGIVRKIYRGEDALYCLHIVPP
jgi:hypothetical protein